jgi:LysM repeat protein
MKIKKKVEEPVMEEIIEEPVVEEVQEERVDEPEFYIFKTTDTLEKVAEKFGTTVDKLKELNDNREISTSNQMRVR